MTQILTINIKPTRTNLLLMIHSGLVNLKEATKRRIPRGSNEIKIEKDESK
jgi:hypothetical protein